MTPTSDPHPHPLASIREVEFPFTRDAVYLNAASAGPLPERSRRTVDAFNARRARIHELTDADFAAPVTRTRELAARLVGADPAEIALGGNTSFGINLAALALPVERGSAIVVSDREFPANVYPWMAREGARLELVPADALGRPDEDRLFERLDRGDVGIFALSSVQFATGYRARVEEFGRFCHERGIHFVVDGIQSLGQIPLDVRAAHIDILATGGHKWLCSPFGTGFAYVRRELQEVVRPVAVGWSSMRASADLGALLDYEWRFLDDARRYEVATPPFQGYVGMAESLGLLLEVGVDTIAAHIERVLDPLVTWLRDTDGAEVVSDLAREHRSGIVCFRTPAPEQSYGRLREAGVHCGLREGAIRVAAHLYNTPGEVARVVGVLEESRERGWT